MFNKRSTKELQECFSLIDYQEALRNMDVVAVGLEGLEVLINLKGIYPWLRVGYIYYEDLGYLPDWNGNLVAHSFSYLPLITDVACVGNHWYKVQAIDTKLIHDVLSYLSREVIIIGAMYDPSLVKLLGFYAFNQKTLLLRRPLYFETSSLRDSINKYLRFSSLPANIKVIDTNKMNRCFSRLGEQRLMIQIHQEMMAHWYAHLVALLGLSESDYFDSPQLRLEACLF